MAAARVLPWPGLDDATLEQTDNLSFMRPLKSESLKLIVTSPPYSIRS
jgi:hypothetical protein